uniref:Putative secreted protein n=1 Tax=Anopheles darlingi TaxID=43151 RepID=A0A2M4DC35_ANODA
MLSSERFRLPLLLPPVLLGKSSVTVAGRPSTVNRSVVLSTDVHSVATTAVSSRTYCRLFGCSHLMSTYLSSLINMPSKKVEVLDREFLLQPNKKVRLS